MLFNRQPCLNHREDVCHVNDLDADAWPTTVYSFTSRKNRMLTEDGTEICF